MSFNGGDAFLCRLLILLRAREGLLRWLNVPGHTGRMAPFSTSPMKAMEEVRDDPLFYLREAVHLEWSVGLYRVESPEQLVWETCFIEDSYIPVTGAYKNREKASREIEKLFDEDSLLFSGTSKPVHAVRRGE